MSDDVTRYEMVDKSRGHDAWQDLERDPDGDWVRYDDYAALAARLRTVEAENARLREDAARLDGVRRFVGRCIAEWDWQCHIDGGDVQEWALRDGLLEQVEMAERCGDSCQCAELVNDFPMKCYRLTQIGQACRDAARAQEARDDA